MRQVGKTKFHWVRRVLVFCWEHGFPVALHGALAKDSGCGRRWKTQKSGVLRIFTPHRVYSVIEAGAGADSARSTICLAMGGKTKA